MISYLSGELLRKDEKYIILNVKGVGYKVFLSVQNMRSLDNLKKVELFCYTNTKKDIWEIYGFFSVEALVLFETLIKIAGIGPRAALEVSSLGSLAEIERAIQEDDRVVIDKLFTLGQKKAQAIIFEFSRKIKKHSKEDEIVIKSLRKLGFEKLEIKETLSQLPPLAAEDKIREVLKLLGKRTK